VTKVIARRNVYAVIYFRVNNRHTFLGEVTIMQSKCPGQDIRNLRAAMYRCPKCGNEVEMFSDELRIRCKKCGEYVYKEQTPSCIEWCPSAQQCLGEERWKALKGILD
jgi:NADH pyrophosphatase NudC (nudix superfamily)